MERKINISKLRTLTDTEIGLLEAGLKLLLIQGQKTTRGLAQTMLDQKMIENMMWGS